MKLYNVEIFREGTWKGTTFTKKDLEAIVSAFKALQGEIQVPIKITHADEKLSGSINTYAWGWVKELWVDVKYSENTGQSTAFLKANFENVQPEIVEHLEKGRLRGRSIELLINYSSKINDTSYSYVLKAVSLLGAQMPAVPGLEDIRLTDEEARHIAQFDVLQFSYPEVEDDGDYCLAGKPPPSQPRSGDAESKPAEAEIQAEIERLKAENRLLMEQHRRLKEEMLAEKVEGDVERLVRESRISRAAAEHLTPILLAAGASEPILTFDADGNPVRESRYQAILNFAARFAQRVPEGELLGNQPKPNGTFTPEDRAMLRQMGLDVGEVEESTRRGQFSLIE